MKKYSRFIGIGIMVLGLGILTYSELSKIENNALLLTSGILILIGLFSYILAYKYSNS